MYYISPDNEYPRHVGDVQLVKPSFEIGGELPAGWTLVADAPSPEKEEGKVVEEVFPTEVDGVMTRTWVVRDETAEEEARRLAPQTAKQKLLDLGLTEDEIFALSNRMVL